MDCEDSHQCWCTRVNVCNLGVPTRQPHSNCWMQQAWRVHLIVDTKYTPKYSPIMTTSQYYLVRSLAPPQTSCLFVIKDVGRWLGRRLGECCRTRRTRQEMGWRRRWSRTRTGNPCVLGSSAVIDLWYNTWDLIFDIDNTMSIYFEIFLLSTFYNWLLLISRMLWGYETGCLKNNLSSCCAIDYRCRCES